MTFCVTKLVTCTLEAKIKYMLMTLMVTVLCATSPVKVYAVRNGSKWYTVVTGLGSAVVVGPLGGWVKLLKPQVPDVMDFLGV